MYKNKYIKYKNKYLELKNRLQIGGMAQPLHVSDSSVDEIIKTTEINIRDNIRYETEDLYELSVENITKLNIDKLKSANEYGRGQYGIVYNLSPSYVIKTIKINQKNESTTISEIRMGYFVEHLNKTIPLYSGNLAHFKTPTCCYLIMRKFNSINTLESNIKPECNLFDVAISLISQLYVLTKKLSTLNISHGDEKFDNLLFEDTRNISDNFEYTIGGNSYKIKNCGFRLRLIDWGEISNVGDMVALWDPAWLGGIKKGIEGITKDSNENKQAPTTDYLVSICKLIGDLGLDLEHELFEAKYADFINNYVDYTPKDMEQFKLDLLLGDENDKTKIFNKIGNGKISGLYDTFSKLKESFNTAFLSYEDKVDFDQIDFDKLPRFMAEKVNETWNVKYCAPPATELPREITYRELKDNLAKYITNNTSNKITSECKYYEQFVSGLSDNFALEVDVSTQNIDDKIYKEQLKKYFDDSLKINSVFVEGNIDFANSVVTIIRSEKYVLLLLVSKTMITDKSLKIFPLSNPGPKPMDLTPETKIKINYLGGAVLTNKPPIKDLFRLIKDSIISKGIQIVIFPLGFFHFHLTFNKLLNKFFGVVHAKFEITHELRDTGSDGYMKTKVQYERKLETLVDLTQGDKKDNILEHNYVFELDVENNVAVYKLNCIPPEWNQFNILGDEDLTFGINDNFFNTNKFADINYYYDKRINEKEDYVIICKTKPSPAAKLAGSDELFFNNNTPFKCSKIMSEDDYRKEARRFGINASDIDDYVRYRKEDNLSTDAAQAEISLVNEYRKEANNFGITASEMIDSYVSYRKYNYEPDDAYTQVQYDFT
jgi:hypothetical protein